MFEKGAGPRVSVVMANLNGAAHIGAAVRSVLRQTERSLELIVSDDGSDDDSLARAEAAAAGDPRLTLLTSEKRRSGPAAARNRALARARGRWVAIVDNDDFIHPERLERLIDAAEADGADIAADDLLTFYDDVRRAPHPHLRGAMARAPTWVSAAAFERSNHLLRGGRVLGYLKPVLRNADLHYDESLRIAEDADLVLRLLAAGKRMRVYPELGYFYRKHGASISHRLDLAAIDAIEDASQRIDDRDDPALRRALAEGRAAAADARAFTKLIHAMKARDIGGALKAALSRPSALALLRHPIAARLRPRPRPRAVEVERRVTLLSRQRIVGATNGSSAYVLALVGALANAGYAVDYIGASPKLFGRWAAMRLRPETRAFSRYLVHGGVRIGPFMVARNPTVWVASGIAVLEALLRKLGLPARFSKRAEYAQGAPATRADQLFVARAASPDAAAVLCDYCFLAPLAAYAMAPAAPSLSIMHDLMSARVTDAATEAIPGAVAGLTAAAEFRLLGLTDAVIAIQQTEAASVAAALPDRRVILAPHAADIAPAPQAGTDDTLLFVGSNTPPNVVGLEWFFREVWPAIRAARPDAKLDVAGSVGRALSAAPDGVVLLGVVGDLAPLYRSAGVVISPLRTGSGLKIKLIEAMAAGKAAVGTSVTMQGVEAIVEGAAICEDDPKRFASAVIALLGDASRRRDLAAAARACAEAHFSAQACFAQIVDYVRGADAAPLQKALPESAPTSQ